MKIYQINSVYKYGSTGKICADISKLLIQNGHESRIAFGRGSFVSGDNGYLISNKKEVIYHALISRLTDKHGLYSDKATERLIYDIENYDPDIIHLHNLHGYYLNYKKLFVFLKDYNKPIIWTLHDCWAFTGHCAHFDSVACDKWKTGCKQCPQKKMYPKSIVMDRSIDNYLLKKKLFTSVLNMTIVTPSVWLKNRVEESFLCKYPVDVIYNGIDMNIFKPVISEFREIINATNKKIILGVSNVWSKNKGLDDFVALQSLLSSDYLIILVGVSEYQKKQLPKEIMAISRTSDIQQLVEMYSAADVYFNASVEETMGLTTVEALACGTPVVVYNKTAIPEVVPENGGIILDKGNIADVKKAIDKLIISKKNDYQSMVFQYDKQNQYTKYLKLYMKILNEG